MLRIVCLPGDGIGPEVTAVAIDVLRALPLELEIEEHAFGGRAISTRACRFPLGRWRRARRPTQSSSAQSVSLSSRVHQCGPSKD